VKTISFSRGRNFFVREISSGLSTIHEEARTLFAMLLRNELDVVRQARVSEIVSSAKLEWLLRFEKSVKAVSESAALPRKIFFTSDTDMSSIFSDLITTSKPELLLEGSFDVQYLDQLIVSKFVSFETEVTRDPFIVIEALFAEKILKQHT